MKTYFYLFLTVLCLFVSCEKTETPYISIEGKTEYQVSSSPVVIPVRIYTNQSDWTYTVSVNWIKVGAVTDSGLELTVLQNTQSDSRTTEVLFSAPKLHSKVETALTITQEGKPEDPYFDVASGAIKFEMEAAGGELSIPVQTNQSSWGFSTDSDWIKGSKSASALVLTVDKNTVDSQRTAQITLFAPDSDSYMFKQVIKLVQAPAEIQYDETCLSESGTSNCYIIQHKGPYSFDAKIKGNGLGGSKLSAPESLVPYSAKLVWQTSKNMINAVSLDDEGFVHFTANRVPGNALLAVCGETGEIIWSWHIWYPEVEVMGLETYEGSYLMNLNLGALSDIHTAGIKTFGLLYQWGRKDPFPGSPVPSGGNLFTKNVEVYDISGETVSIEASDMFSTKVNTIKYSIAHPTVCLSNNEQYKNTRDWIVAGQGNTALWGNPDGFNRKEGDYYNHGTKTYYDPCPPGWRVPYQNVLKDITSTSGYIWASGEKYGKMDWVHMFGEASFAGYDWNGDGLLNLNDWNDGWYIKIGPDSHSYFPATTRYDGQYAMLMGSMVGLWANYWYNSPTKDDGGLSEAMIFSIKDYNGGDAITASGISSGSRADAYAVRCIRDDNEY